MSQNLHTKFQSPGKSFQKQKEGGQKITITLVQPRTALDFENNTF